MRKIRVFTLVITVILTALCVFGCSPKLDEAAAAVAVKYYSDVIMKQDIVSANEYCAYDRVALTEELYNIWAAEEGVTLEEYVQSLADKKGIETPVSTVSDLLSAQSALYVETKTQQLGTDYFSRTPAVVSHSAKEDDTVKEVYDGMITRYAKEDIDFTEYLSFDSIEESVIVSVSASEDGSDISDVVLVKIGENWLYLN